MLSQISGLMNEYKGSVLTILIFVSEFIVGKN